MKNPLSRFYQTANNVTEFASGIHTYCSFPKDAALKQAAANICNASNLYSLSDYTDKEIIVRWCKLFELHGKSKYNLNIEKSETIFYTNSILISPDCKSAWISGRFSIMHDLCRLFRDYGNPDTWNFSVILRPYWKEKSSDKKMLCIDVAGILPDIATEIQNTAQGDIV